VKRNRADLPPWWPVAGKERALQAKGVAIAAIGAIAAAVAAAAVAAAAVAIAVTVAETTWYEYLCRRDRRIYYQQSPLPSPRGRGRQARMWLHVQLLDCLCHSSGSYHLLCEKLKNEGETGL
jgi:hypothetical protein